jgi:hypothetical protein
MDIMTRAFISTVAACVPTGISIDIRGLETYEVVCPCSRCDHRYMQLIR